MNNRKRFRIPRVDLVRGFDLRDPKYVDKFPIIFVNRRHTIAHILWPNIPDGHMRLKLTSKDLKTMSDDMLKIYFKQRCGFI